MGKLFWSLAAVTLILPAPLLSWGDEILLKDGKKIEWSSIKDNGDSYEVVAPNGAKTTVRKNDIKEVVVAPVATLTGAAFEFKKGQKMEMVDLFKGLDVQKAASSGSWSTVNGALAVNGAKEAARMEFPSFGAPEEYDLNVVVERTGSSGNFNVGMVGGGHQFFILVDHHNKRTVMANVDGRGYDDSSVSVATPVFTADKPVSLTFMIRKEGLVMKVNGKDYLTWCGDWSRVSSPASSSMRAKDSLLMGCGGGAFKISRAVVTTPKD